MTTVAYLLGRPPVAAKRGGDCRARDLAQGRNVLGPHRFAATTDCRISNGMLRATVSASTTPVLVVETYRPSVTVGDVYDSVYQSVYGGSLSTPEWIALGTVVCSSTSVAAVITGVRLTRVTRAAVTIRLVAPAVGDILVTLRRGERMLRITHGDPRRAVSVVRRVRSGVTLSTLFGPSRVEESPPATDGIPRFIASHDPVTLGVFNLTSTAAVRSAVFAFGVGIGADGERPADLHSQLADASVPELVVA